MAEPKSDWENFLELLISFDFDEWTDWIGEWGISRALFLSILYAGMLAILNTQIPNLALFAFSWVVGTAPIWLPVVMIVAFYRVWIWYARSLYLSKQHFVLLEIKMPREITKSPRAMETIIASFWMGSQETTFLMRVIQGQVRPWYSLEMASFGGEVHFYIQVWKGYQGVIEANIYSQYPEVELVEVEDYSQKFVFDPKIHTCYCTDWRLEPHRKNIDAYPIKTYIDLELDQDPKEEFKVDPLATVLDFLSSIKPTQQVWIQIVLTADWKTGVLVRKDSMWQSMVEHEVEKIRLESATFKEGHATEEQLRIARPRATWKQTKQIETMERNLGKHPFDVGTRGIFISTNEDFGREFWTLRWLWRPFANPQYMSQLRPRRWHNPFDYPWQDFHDFRWDLTTKRFIDAYRRRSFFYTPWETPTNMMTSEVLATIFHPPSRAITSPGLMRIPAKKAEPPPNLPK
ncbi:hypothetical protein A3F27_02110 [Candidatus Kaiserbacteria bacterium RIFCSPHIGHO2_12_FULL_53_13]|uniref:Uncharacterized protein n=1 Tax=Candidatus Kaiserbacteria bacterium RIFCSPHIGHO2_12_FULL_53_13 TaxID=1798502 RepID=A0A1F6EC93_9BACT|nr:MAG: hypothetical protein A3F27_02110 [Candidatus Kaiserbacteria bacterium RIFCSPHIGHO2_12_FULL_53_13]OGG74457.1 MAG: hypothetical protein A3A37_02290 [Candidatus Kaiserbacteria bacterium RIFCSPLOWO2_01_FULL_52_36]